MQIIIQNVCISETCNKAWEPLWADRSISHDMNIFFVFGILNWWWVQWLGFITELLICRLFYLFTNVLVKFIVVLFKYGDYSGQSIILIHSLQIMLIQMTLLHNIYKQYYHYIFCFWKAVGFVCMFVRSCIYYVFMWIN